MSANNRLGGGQIDRSKSLSFSFDGTRYQGFAGDTLASALLANGVRLMGRSFKYHRPRGVLTSGSDEPNALVELRQGARQEPNTRATTIELFDGLVAKSQNRWPSLSFDLMAANNLLAPFFGAGFYYKTFMWPAKFWESVYEPMIRRAAGLGRLSGEEDPDSYAKGFLHCDLLVIGSGPSGLMAALQAGRSGARVILAEEDFACGGRLLSETEEIGGQSGVEWASQIVSELSSMPNVRLMSRTCIFGAYDHGIYGALERTADHLPIPPQGKPRQILWRIYSGQAILCAGAGERPIVFSNNDRPGIMLGGAVRSYAERFAVASGQRAVVFTATDEGYKTAQCLQDKGIEVAAIVDPRPSDTAASPETPALKTSAQVVRGEIIDTHGRLALSGVRIMDQSGQILNLDCDLLAVSGGWSPNVHLTCHQRSRPKWDQNLAAFVPGDNLPVGMQVAGSAAGEFSTAATLRSGVTAARDALKALGIKTRAIKPPVAEDGFAGQTPFWRVRSLKGRAWVDFQNDVTSKDVTQAVQEGYRSVEHLKRYTTLGMATDQGKTSNIVGLALLAEATGASIEQTGTTMFRPPYSPVAISAFGGGSTGKEFKPTRLTPSHHWAKDRGAVFIEAGQWLRAQWYPIAGETHWRQSCDREALAVRQSVGVCDVTTLGKIDVQGADAATFLNRVYCNGFAKLKVGRVRYGLMLREDGVVMDDGTAARLAEDHFVVTTTTANAVGVYRHMEFCRQVLWPSLDVQLISTTEAWAQFAVAGPNSRAVLQKLVDPDCDISNEAFPYMACGEITICGGLRARLFRVSFSGELAYEIAVPTRYGDALIRQIMEAGAEYDITPYGTEALGVLRMEKGHMTGNELNGQTTAAHLGMAALVSRKKDSIGSVLSQREEMVKEDGYRLVGLMSTHPNQSLPAGSHLFRQGDEITAAFDQGWITSACYSPNLKCAIALAMLKRGNARHDEVIVVANPVENQQFQARVVSPHMIDPEGERLRA